MNSDNHECQELQTPRAPSKMTAKVQNQLFTACLLNSSNRREDDYIYVGDIFRRTFLNFPFWKKKKTVTVKDRLIGNLLK